MFAFSELPDDVLQEYMELFSYFDRDGGGSIGVEELGQVMRAFHWNPSDSEIKVTSFDTCCCIIFQTFTIYLRYFHHTFGSCISFRTFFLVSTKMEMEAFLLMSLSD